MSIQIQNYKKKKKTIVLFVLANNLANNKIAKLRLAARRILFASYKKSNYEYSVLMRKIS